MTLEELKSMIEKQFPGIALKPVRNSLLLEQASDLPKVAGFLKDSELQMDYLSSVTGADYLSYLESVYHFYSMARKSQEGVVLRVRTPRDNPKVPSLTPLFRSAEYQERQAYDMYGIVYEGHPDLRRIFMWEGFEGFPLRKDYVQENAEELDATDVAWLEQHGVKAVKPS